MKYEIKYDENMMRVLMGLGPPPSPPLVENPAEEEVLAQSSARQDRSSTTVDKIKTTAREEQVLALSSATQEKSSKQRVDRIYTSTQQEKYKIGLGEEEVLA